jgi:hypothetical protein
MATPMAMSTTNAATSTTQVLFLMKLRIDRALLTYWKSKANVRGSHIFDK